MRIIQKKLFDLYEKYTIFRFMGAKSNKKSRQGSRRNNNSNAFGEVELKKPSLTQRFRAFATPSKIAIVGTISASLGAVSLLGTTSPFIEAESDPEIITACPQMSDVELVTIPEEKISNTHHVSTFKVGALVPPNLMTPQQIDRAYNTLHSLETAQNHETTHLEINSIGGNLGLASTYIYFVKGSRGNVVTSASKIAASAATLVLFSGNKDRRTFDDTIIVVHSSRIFKYPEQAEDFLIKNIEPTLDDYLFEEDFVFNRSKEKALMAIKSVPDLNTQVQMAGYLGISESDLVNYRRYDAAKTHNNWMRDQYVELSDKTITPDCAKTLVRGKDDVLVSTSTALRFKWIDTVRQKSSWTGLPNGMITIRADDPRAKKHFPQKMEARLNY